MRAFLLLCALLLACLAAGALLAYPAHLLVHPLNPDWPFHRIASRLSMLLLLVGLIWLLKHLRVDNRHSLGFGLPAGRFLRQSALALAAGVAMMLPIVGLLYTLGVRGANPDTAITAATIGAWVLKGLVSGLVVALIEETVLRGAMHSAIEREAGARAAVLLTALIYAALHFLNKTRIPHEQVDAGSGIELLSGALTAFAHPLPLIDSFFALFAVGVLLGLVRLRTGAIAACIGLHAGWMCVIAVTRALTVRNFESPWSFLVGSYDGIVGYLVLAWTAMIIYLIWRRPGAGTKSSG